MPYCCRPQLTLTPGTINNTPSDNTSNTNVAHNSHCQSVMSAIIDYNCSGLSHLSILATLTPLHQPYHMLWWTTSFPPMQNRSSIFIGLSIHLGASTSHPLSLLPTSPSASILLGTIMSLATHYFAHLWVALIQSAAGMSFFIISWSQAIICKSMDIWFILCI